MICFQRSLIIVLFSLQTKTSGFILCIIWLIIPSSTWLMNIRNKIMLINHLLLLLCLRLLSVIPIIIPILVVIVQVRQRWNRIDICLVLLQNEILLSKMVRNSLFFSFLETNFSFDEFANTSSICFFLFLYIDMSGPTTTNEKKIGSPKRNPRSLMSPHLHSRGASRRTMSSQSVLSSPSDGKYPSLPALHDSELPPNISHYLYVNTLEGSTIEDSMFIDGMIVNGIIANCVCSLLLFLFFRLRISLFPILVLSCFMEVSSFIRILILLSMFIRYSHKKMSSCIY